MDVTTVNMAVGVTMIVRAPAGLVTIHQCVWKVRMGVILRNYVINVEEENIF